MKACVEELEPQLEQAKAGAHPTLVTNDKHYYRLTNADALVPAAKFFYESPLVWDVVRAYMSPKAESYRREAEMRSRISTDVSAEDLFHFDTWHPNVKAFLYLTDVEPETGPFRYLLGTHRKASWRRKRELEFECDGFGGSFGHFFPGEVEQLRQTYGFQERVFLAKAGTLILGDFRGLHRGHTAAERQAHSAQPGVQHPRLGVLIGIFPLGAGPLLRMTSSSTDVSRRGSCVVGAPGL